MGNIRKKIFLFLITILVLFFTVQSSNAFVITRVHEVARANYSDRVEAPVIAIEKEETFHVVFTTVKNIGTKSASANLTYCQSKDGGFTWTIPLDIPGAASRPNRVFALTKDIAIEPNGAIDIVWGEKMPSMSFSGRGIFLSRSVNGGKTWSQPITIAKTGTLPVIAIGPDSSIHVVWNSAKKQPNKEKSSYIYYTQKSKEGWSKAKNISYAFDGVKGFSCSPRIVCNSQGKVCIQWAGGFNGIGQGHLDNWILIGSQKGEFEKPINISKLSENEQLENIVSSYDCVNLAWYSVAHFQKEAKEIGNKTGLVNKLSADGETILLNFIDLSNTGCKYPGSIIVAKKKAMIVWEDGWPTSRIKIFVLSLDDTISLKDVSQ